MLYSKFCFCFYFTYLLFNMSLGDTEVQETFPRSSVEHIPPPSGGKCDLVITSEDAHIFSPLHPARYSQFSDCLYTIKRFSRDVCRVTLMMEFFELIETQNCTQDYLLLQSGHGRHRLCGKLPPGTIKYLTFPDYSETLLLKFRSGYMRAYGFSIAIKQIRHSCNNQSERITGPKVSSCNQEVRGRWARITSPGYPHNYKPGENCAYIIYKSEPLACSIELDFLHFDVMASPLCRGDYLLLPDGTRLCGNINSMKKSLLFPPGTERLTLLFTTDKNINKAKGFNIQINQFPGPCGINTQKPAMIISARQCDQEVRTTTGQFTSPGFPQYFGPNYRCTYIVRRSNPSVCQLELQFTTFDVGKHNPPSCAHGAYFELPGHVLLCHPFTGRKIIGITEFQDPIVFHFVSDRYSSGRGFEINILQIPNTCRGFEKGPPPITEAKLRCYQEVSKEYGYFSIPKRSLELDSPEICDFVIKKAHPLVCTIQLQLSFPKLTLVPCATNYILLPTGEKYCIEYSLTREIAFPRDMKILRLTYYGYNGAEFSLVVNQLKNCPKLSEPMIFKGSENLTWDDENPHDYF